MTPVEVKLEGVEYVGYLWGKQITKQRSLEKCLKKLMLYVKSQS